MPRLPGGRWIRILLKLSLAGLATFLLLELTLLAFNDQIFSRAFYVYDPDLGFRARPGFEWWPGMRTNEFGLNDRDYPHERTPGTCRVLALGDSFNWVGGLQGNYAAQLEDMLAEEVGPGRIEVINIGYGGTHTAEQLQLLEKFGLLYKPDLLLLAFFAGNDLVDADPHRRAIAYGESLINLDPRKERETLLFGQPLLWRSRLLALGRHFLRLATEGSPAPLPKVPHFTLPRQVYLEVEYARMSFDKKSLREDYAGHQGYIIGALEQMRILLYGHQIDFMIFAIPDEYQVDDQLRRSLLSEHGEDDSLYEWNRAQALLSRFASSRNVPFIDLLPAFRNANQSGQRLYWPEETHWNEAGIRLAVETLFPPVLQACQAKIETPQQLR